MAKKKQSRTAKALKYKADSMTERQIAREFQEQGQTIAVASHLSYAQSLDNAANTTLMQPLETDPADYPVTRVVARMSPEQADAVSEEASRSRAELLLSNGVADLALDARNNPDVLEDALIDQLMLCHKQAFQLMDRADIALTADPLSNYLSEINKQREAANIQAARLINSADRMMKTFQSGMETLAKLRNSSKPKVQNLNAEAGSQVVVGDVTVKQEDEK